MGIGSSGYNPPIPAVAKLVGEPPEGGAVKLVQASDDVKLRVAVWPAPDGGGAPRGTILLLHGRTEYIEKYYPVIVELRDRGFAVATMDWRGQGLSERPIGHPLKGHVDDFAEYQRDLDALLAEPAVQSLPEPMVVMSHSMGGAVMTRRLQKEADRFVGAIFSAPMLGLLPTPGVDKVTQVAAKVVSTVGLRTEYAPGQPIDPYTDVIFMSNVLTSDYDEYSRQRELIKEEPGLAIAGVTWGWLRATLNELGKLELSEGHKLRSLYWIGSEESVVSAPAIGARVAASRNARFALITGAKHEPLFERPEIRARVWREVDSFLSGLGLLPKRS